MSRDFEATLLGLKTMGLEMEVESDVEMSKMGPQNPYDQRFEMRVRRHQKHTGNPVQGKMAKIPIRGGLYLLWLL